MKPAPPAPILTATQISSLGKLRQRFAQLPDFRVAGRTLHRLDEMLMIALCSMLSDNDSFTDMGVFAQTQLPWLRTFLTLENGAPSHDVFRNLFMALRPATLGQIIRDWCGDLSGQHVTIDGKVLRGTYDGTTAQCMVHVLRAWVAERSLSAGHVSCEQKSNEIEALPRLLDALVLQGAVVSIDAMGTQTAIARQIHEAGADYVLALKANQKQAMEALAAHFNAADERASASAPQHQSHETVALSHGRFERREYQATAELSWWPKSWKWEGLKSVVRVRRWTHRGAQQGDELALETHYYLSSLPADAQRLAQIIRGHWSVENSCHHVLDVTFQEDHCQVRDINAAQNLSILREIALRALKTHASKGSMRAKRKRAALDPYYRTQLIADITHPF